MRRDIKNRYCRFSRDKVGIEKSGLVRNKCSGGPVVDAATHEKHCEALKEVAAGCSSMDLSKPDNGPCEQSTVCSICYMRSLQKPRSVQLECKHFLCNVCYSKVYSCPFCRCPLYGCIGKRLKRATKMFLCLLKQFKQNSCCKASSVLLLQKLLEKTKERAKMLDPNKEGVKKITSRIYTLSGTVYCKLLGELDRACVEYTEALNLYPENLEALNLYAGVLSRQGLCRGQEPVLLAINLMNRAVKLDPENPILLCNLSKYYAQLGDVETAIRFLDKAAQLQGSNESAQKYVCLTKQLLSSQIISKQALTVDPVPGHQCVVNVSTVSPVSGLQMQKLCKD